ncbi:MAG: DEAD/DEAH box helicase [Elusimicrobiales bacterium]|nr:DEAD/DEAH box helicase [Elusimicrobiales bacterium]
MTDNNTTENTSDDSFYGLGIAPKLLEILDSLKCKIPTPIQKKSIPIASTGKDMVGIAQTGTGKTIAFAIPMVQRLAANQKEKALILVPTRELALQVASVVKTFSMAMGIRSVPIIGGESIKHQLREFKKKPRILIATPGRLIDHLNHHTITLSDVRVLVLDEADRMFDMGFAPQITKIIDYITKKRQTMLFSATMPKPIMKLAEEHMQTPTRIEIARAGTAAEAVKQELYILSRGDRPALLAKLLDKYWGSVLLFVRTKRNATKIADAIRKLPHSATEIHSNRSLAQRRRALEGFKSGEYRIMVATDVAARGIDVTNIELVINYEIPDEEDNYVHRIGRTGRAGKPGHAITFAAPEQGREVRTIEGMIRVKIPVVTHPDIDSCREGFGSNYKGKGKGKQKHKSKQKQKVVQHPEEVLHPKKKDETQSQGKKHSGDKHSHGEKRSPSAHQKSRRKKFVPYGKQRARARARRNAGIGR